MRKVLSKIFITFVLLFSLSTKGYSLDVETHKAINEYIAINSLNGFSLDTYLKTGLGMQADKTAKFDTNMVWEWLRDGGYYEDKPPWTLPYRRSVNHFHNPITKAGFSGIWGTGFLQGDSTVVWAQKAKGTQSPGGYYSWNDVRDYYLKALTSSDSTTRNTNFANTFRGLGQLMHLVQDMSVPEHARDDGHYTYAYEEWVRDSPSSNDPVRKGILNNALANPIFFDSAALMQESPFTNASAPIANLFDTNQYNGTNPQITASNNAIGLSEYTNANFFSADNIANNTFPYPKIYYESPIDIRSFKNTATGITNPRLYYSKKSEGETNNGHGYLISTVDFLHDWRTSMIPIPTPDQPIFPILDDNVYQDYASLLLPRAVGYSAGLLNYFFRGQLETTIVNGGLKVKNAGTEVMTSGNSPATISIYYDDSSGNRQLLASQELTAPLNPGDETTIYFSEPANKRYIVVFQGKLGNEEGAVIGKIALPPPSYYVATVGGADKIMKTDSGGTSQSVVYDNPYGYVIGKIAVSPDGNTLAFSASPGGLTAYSSILLLNLADLTAAPTVLVSGNWPSWSPDGKKIVFERDISTNPASYSDTEIFIIDVSSGATTQLTPTGSYFYRGQPAWSPTTNTIAYTEGRASTLDCQTPYVISLMDISGNPIRHITCPPSGEYMSVGDSAPAWSPDGAEIGFSRQKYYGRSNQLYKVNISSSTLTKLTDSPDTGYYEYAASWSADGRTIAIGSNRDGDYDIWLVDSGGGYLSNLTNSNSGVDGYPACGK